eukprot:766806-Hanusia_phi.AAC.12
MAAGQDPPVCVSLHGVEDKLVELTSRLRWMARWDRAGANSRDRGSALQHATELSCQSRQSAEEFTVFKLEAGAGGEDWQGGGGSGGGGEG